MDVICPKDKCTGCGACRDICPKKCISLKEDVIDAVYPHVNQENCVKCGQCYRTCPNNRDLDFHFPMTCYAAWSLDNNCRMNSASGGVAAELYHYAIKNGFFSSGVCWDRERGACYIPVLEESDIWNVRNSKYVYSDTSGIYIVIKNKLEEGVSVLFIGLPCQVAGLYGYLKKNYDNLITVDIICHGVAPLAYLEQHLRSIEEKKRKQTKSLSFRNPKYHTFTYSLTLSGNDNQEFYKKTVNSFDNYQLGYHHALIYRDNCYQCSYARAERISDLTIGDFSGLGRFKDCKYDWHNVSCVLVNTDRGNTLFNEMKDFLSVDERPLEEALLVENQLRRPSVAHPRRDVFLYKYKLTHDFVKSANSSLKGDKIFVFRKKIVNVAKELIRMVVPAFIIRSIKNK